jgi:hypothetical protein
LNQHPQLPRSRDLSFFWFSVFQRSLSYTGTGITVSVILLCCLERLKADHATELENLQEKQRQVPVFILHEPF